MATTRVASRSERVAARIAFRRIALQPLAWPVGDEPVSFAFSWGPRVRFVLPDCRWARSPRTAPDGPAKSMLGGRGKAWLFDELATAAADPAVVLVCLGTEVPCISSDGTGDDWSVYVEERAEIARFIEDRVVGAGTTVLGLASDAHMNAFDDGTNNPWGRFAVLQAGALERRGSVKGGPDHTGAFPNAGDEGDVGQFCLVRVLDEVVPCSWRQVSGRQVTTDGHETVQFTEWRSVRP